MELKASWKERGRPTTRRKRISSSPTLSHFAHSLLVLLNYSLSRAKQLGQDDTRWDVDWSAVDLSQTKAATSSLLVSLCLPIRGLTSPSPLLLL
jgi:hypothetical protein